MKSLIALLLMILSDYASAQTGNMVGIDCNPRLYPGEMAILKPFINAEVKELAGKNIGFAKSGDGMKLFGIAHSFLPVTKKEFFNLLSKDTKHHLAHKLFMLDSIQKKATNGFDAIVLLFDKKHLQKINTKTVNRVVTIFGYRQLNYPDNLNAVGKDSNNEISEQDALFFNQVFQFKRGDFDFNGKKIAFVNTNETDKSNAIKTKKLYIERIKKHLENDFLFPYDYLITLDQKEKTRSGGYDAIILYQCKLYDPGEVIKIITGGES